MQPILEITDLSHSFGGLKALTDFSLEIFPGELVGLIGPNGAGKTTVFNLITGVFRISQGRIFFRGEDISDWRSHRITAAGIARTFQNIRLFKELSVLDNVRLGAFAPTSLFPAGCPAAQPAVHCGRAGGNQPGL